MARYTGPKFRLDRREGENLYLKGKRSSSPKHPIERKGIVPPGQHGQKATRRKVSDFGLQLREKQKVKRIYGVLERQFRRYFGEASKETGNTGEALFRTLETRLDNVVYRLGLASSRAAARQLVGHAHVKVNDKKVDIPSYSVKAGDIISLSEKAQKFLVVDESIKFRGDTVPSWLERKALVGKVLHDPTSDDLDTTIDKQLIIEFYSR